MSKHEKLLEKIRQNPRNVRFEQIDALLLSFGFEKRQKGSHATYILAGIRPITVPFRKPFILPIYVKQILERLAEIE